MNLLFARPHTLRLLAVAGLFAGITFLWLYLDHCPPAWDDAWYLTNSLVMWDALADGGIAGYVKRFFTVLGFKAPLITVLPTPVYLVLGRHARYACLVNLFFMAVLFASVYFIAARIATPRAGLIAVCIAGTMPLLYGLSHWFLVEYPLTALVSLALALLLVSDNLSRPAPAIAFGVLSGFGLLLKATYPLYVGPLFLLALARSRAIGRAIARVAIPALALALPWYAVHYKDVLSFAWRSSFAEEAAAWGAGIGAYIPEAIRTGPSWYYVLLGIVILALRRRPVSRQAAILCGLWVLPFLVFLFARNKDVRFLAPLLPAVALFLGCVIDGAFPHRSKWVGLILVFPLAAMIGTSFGPTNIFHDLRYARRYRPERWPHVEILKAASSGKTLLVGTDTESFNANNFELAAVEKRLPIEVTTSAYEKDLGKLLATLQSVAFFVFKEGGAPGSAHFNVHGKALEAAVRAGGSQFAELDYSPRLPDGGVAHIFENRASETAIRAGLRFVARAFLAGALDRAPEFGAEFGQQIRLEGLALEPSSGALRVDYRWRCLRRPERDYWCFTHVLDEDGTVVAYLDHEVLGGQPKMSSWSPGDRAIEKLELTSPAIHPGRRYRLRLGLFDFLSGQRLPVTRAEPTAQWKISRADEGAAVVASQTF